MAWPSVAPCAHIAGPLQLVPDPQSPGRKHQKPRVLPWILNPNGTRLVCQSWAADEHFNTLKTTTHLWNWACFGSPEQQMRCPNIGKTKGYERDRKNQNWQVRENFQCKEWSWSADWEAIENCFHTKFHSSFLWNLRDPLFNRLWHSLSSSCSSSLWWNSVVKTVSSVYPLLRFCVHDCREESKYMLSQIILLPALFLFTVQSFTIVPAAMSETHDLGARLFVATVAVWLLFWFGKIILVRKSALANRLPVMSVLFSAKFQ